MTDPTFGGFRPGEDAWTTHWRWTAITNGSVLGDLRGMHRPELKGGVPTGMCLRGLPVPCLTAERSGVYTAALDGPCGCVRGVGGSCPQGTRAGGSAPWAAFGT